MVERLHSVTLGTEIYIQGSLQLPFTTLDIKMGKCLYCFVANGNLEHERLSLPFKALIINF